MDQTDPIRMVLADDHTVVRKGIRDFLEEEGDIQVVAEATTGAEAVALTLEHQPHVTVLDIQMPVMTGIEAARQIKAQASEVQVLVLTAYDEDPYIFAMLQAGPAAMCSKMRPPTNSFERCARWLSAVQPWTRWSPLR